MSNKEVIKELQEKIKSGEVTLDDIEKALKEGGIETASNGEFRRLVQTLKQGIAQHKKDVEEKK